MLGACNSSRNIKQVTLGLLVLSVLDNYKMEERVDSEII